MATNAVTFNGSTQYGKINNFAGLGSLTDYCVEFWIKRSSSSPAYATIASFTDETTEPMWWGSEAGANSQGTNFNQKYSGANDADGYINSASGFLPSATWTHIAFVHRTTEKKVFIFKNGVERYSYDLQEVGAGSIVTSASVYFLLAAYYSGGIGADLPCDVGGFVRIWNRAPSGAEIYYNYDKTLTPANESGLIVNCNFSEGSGTVVDNDATPGADLNLIGTPSWTTGPTVSAKSYTNTYVLKQVIASADDAEEANGGGTTDIVSSDLEVVDDGATTQQIGIRFQSVAIPAGATIQAAYLRLVGDETQAAGTENVDIYGEDVDDSAAFAASVNNLTGRTKTTAKVDWDAVPASSPGVIQSSPDIKTVIQEIVDRPGWVTGQDMSIILAPGGSNATRTFLSYDGQNYSGPMLHVEYTVAATLLIRDIIGDGIVPFAR